MDETKTVIIGVDAVESPNLDFPYNDRTVRMYIRCRKNETDLVVQTHTAVQSIYGDFDATRVRYRIDKSAPISSRWLESTGHDAVFAPNAIALAKRLAKSKEFLFEFTPYDAASVTARFDVSRLREALPEVASACKWTIG